MTIPQSWERNTGTYSGPPQLLQAEVLLFFRRRTIADRGANFFVLAPARGGGSVTALVVHYPVHLVTES